MIEYPIYNSRQDVPNLFWRPSLQLRTLPIESRWEVTRRHPSYFAYWKPGNASALFKDEDQISTVQNIMDQSRMIALNAIGVPPEEAVDPALEFPELGEVNSAWTSGAVHPTSIRGLACLLVSLLPKDTLTALGAAFIEGAVDDEPTREGEVELPHRVQACNKIGRLDREGLDQLTPEPFVSINPWASGRQVGEEVKTLLKQWKEELDLSEVRERSKKHKVYLEVWDRREGWKDGAYGSRKCERFVEIANDLKRSLSTVHSQYKAAFNIITGHAYRFDSYIEVFGIIRFSDLFGREGSKYRRLIPSSTRDVPLSKLEVSGPDDLERSPPGVASDEYRAFDLVSDYKNLKSLGKSDAEIASELGVVDMEKLFQLIELNDMS